MEEFTVRVRRLRGKSDIPLPRYMTPHSAGMDLHADLPEPLVLPQGGRGLVPTGLAISLPEGYEAQIRPRSGLALKHGITLLNSPGTIDADYRGEISVIVINHGLEEHTIFPGDRIAQMVIAPFTRVRLLETEELDDTDRGSGGFGHTGR